jgi:CBS domain-containing protein
MDKPTKTAKQLLDSKRFGVAGVVSVGPDDTVLDALRLMADRNVGAVAVCKDSMLVGIMTERDCARKLELQGRSAASTQVREIMTSSVVCANPADSVDRCRVLLSQHRIRHLPVCDGKTLLGVLSSRDILEELLNEEEHLLRDLEIERLAIMSNPGVY